jgi:TonB family protein
MIKPSVVVLVGLAATALLRQRSAALRHLVLATALVLAAATPVLEFVVPAWDLHLRSSSLAPLDGVLAVITDAPDAVVAQVRVEPAQTLNVARVLAPLWTTGAALSLAVLFIGLARLTWLASRSRPITEGRWADLASTLSKEYALKRRVRLLQSDHPTLLVTWGFRSPKVILPSDAPDWPEERVRIVLGHELAHIRRRDWLVQMTAELLRSVYWFNPLLWIACRQLRRESEHACDDLVLKLGVDAPEYATHLLALARAFRQRRLASFEGFPAQAMARRSSLERRVSAMLNAGLNRTPITRPASIAIVCALLAIAVPLAGLGAQVGPAAFSGSLVDTVGRIMPNVPMELVNTGSQARMAGTSDSNGHFSFEGLAAGDYLLGATSPGFATLQEHVTLRAGQSLQRDVALQLGLLHETIRVTSDSPQSPPPPPPPPQPPVVPRGLAPPPPPPPPPPPAPAMEPDTNDPCSQSVVGGCIKQPTKLKDVRPIYPQRYREAGTGGKVELEARIGTDGLVKEVGLAEPGDAELAGAAAAAVRQWRFSQTRLDGVPMEVRMHVSVTFVAW